MQLQLFGYVSDETQLPELGPDDAGATYWIGFTWHIWTGSHWQKAIATDTAPRP